MNAIAKSIVAAAAIIGVSLVVVTAISLFRHRYSIERGCEGARFVYVIDSLTGKSWNLHGDRAKEVLPDKGD